VRFWSGRRFYGEAEGRFGWHLSSWRKLRGTEVGDEGRREDARLSSRACSWHAIMCKPILPHNSKKCAP
jgi:hypothetical protein